MAVDCEWISILSFFVGHWATWWVNLATHPAFMSHLNCSNVRGIKYCVKGTMLHVYLHFLPLSLPLLLSLPLPLSLSIFCLFVSFPPLSLLCFFSLPPSLPPSSRWQNPSNLLCVQWNKLHSMEGEDICSNYGLAITLLTKYKTKNWRETRCLGFSALFYWQ